jgi:hypothetical protein
MTVLEGTLQKEIGLISQRDRVWAVFHYTSSSVSRSFKLKEMDCSIYTFEPWVVSTDQAVAELLSSQARRLREAPTQSLPLGMECYLLLSLVSGM